ncbi:phosphonate transport system permease protein [Deinococcus metalli]|uniref:Phosphonate ABC transporter, permease protein PhnE n=1 Tax=Deinococcus metalli TaxID=1141878 RepID=A0A7W8KJ48_9DEIO|nr:phosphonate ABC transporter, permease protein PhnE [Deinococcus metalli]MBB5379149.1 phosphonate transport system permease protein [Deinococcus metalli]GHF64870.1 phosphonate ABC transporter, permease protein PhnE [Deinococcus metalli]
MLQPRVLTPTPPPEVRRRSLGQFIAWAAVLLVVGLSFQGSEVNLGSLQGGLGNSWRYIFGDPARPQSGFFPPDFSRFGIYLTQMLLTVKMAVLGTVGAVVLSLPLGFLAARNTSPSPLAYQLTRRLLDLLRGLNEFVLALIFVAAVGLGPFPGILALVFHTTGILGKLFAEGIEDIDEGQVEAVRATGAHPLQVLGRGVWPQIVPHVLSMTMYRFESNVRAATVLGLVGAGGIGFYITEAIRGFDTRAASAILIIILASVFLIDFLSAKLRERLQ